MNIFKALKESVFYLNGDICDGLLLYYDKIRTNNIQKKGIKYGTYY